MSYERRSWPDAHAITPKQGAGLRQIEGEGPTDLFIKRRPMAALAIIDGRHTAGDTFRDRMRHRLHEAGPTVWGRNA